MRWLLHSINLNVDLPSSLALIYIRVSSEQYNILNIDMKLTSTHFRFISYRYQLICQSQS